MEQGGRLQALPPFSSSRALPSPAASL